MQNVTAHYNILFNAKELIRLKQDSYAEAFADNYNEILNVYPDTLTVKQKTVDKDLENAILKANTVINVKDQSRYGGDAYLAIGQGYYLEGSYFNSTEFFNYVIHIYHKDTALVQKALAWKARSLMYLNQLPQAKLTIDSALTRVNYKKKKTISPDIFATKLQYDINTQNYEDGEEMAKKALRYCDMERLRFRWTFILAQLQELNQKPKDAYKNYTAVVKSNATFEMAFNASLNRIRIYEAENGIKVNKTGQLLALLKDPNNKEFNDQIYYQAAEIKKDSNKIDDAIKYYKLSLRYNLKNVNQKGLSYLRLAEVYFKNKTDYSNSKKYYDSTLATLPRSYPGYGAIEKKGSNLKLLETQLEIAVRQDTLQALAKMDEKTRMALIDKMVKDNIDNQPPPVVSASPFGDDDPAVYDNSPANANKNIASSFYFYNVNALSRGFGDFKEKWGNIKLDDDWRRSKRPAADISANSPLASVNAVNPVPDAKQTLALKNRLIGENYRKELINGLPLTPELLAQSKTAVYNAYFDLANIYRDVMNDKNESIASFKIVLSRFPDNPNKAMIYYSLYRLYSDVDVKQADYYRSKLLTEYPSTAFAGVILDSNYVKKLNDHDSDVTQAYNVIFYLYAHKQYKEVMSCVPEIFKQYPDNRYAAQLYYLLAISAGHYEKLTVFTDSLKNILKKFPNDKLIDPLIDQHLQYIAANQNKLVARDSVLDNDSLDVSYVLTPGLKREAHLRKKVDPYALYGQAQPVSAGSNIAKSNSSSAQILQNPGEIKQPGKKAANNTGTFSKLFSLRDSANYLFVIQVNSGTTNLSSSRFGVGEFNRAHYAGMGIKHQLADVDENIQLIYVGPFTSFNIVKKYSSGIAPLLPDIMKVPKDKYSFFIITQENLNKLADKKTLDEYLDYYQKNYLP